MEREGEKRKVIKLRKRRKKIKKRRVEWRMK